MYFQGKKTEQNKIEDTLEKAGGEETSVIEVSFCVSIKIRL